MAKTSLLTKRLAFILCLSHHYHCDKWGQVGDNDNDACKQPFLCELFVTIREDNKCFQNAVNAVWLPVSHCFFFSFDFSSCSDGRSKQATKPLMSMMLTHVTHEVKLYAVHLQNIINCLFNCHHADVNFKSLKITPIFLIFFLLTA